MEPTNPNEHVMAAKLAAKILAITKEIGSMPKDGQNKEQRYNFISYEAMNAKFRELLAQYGLCMIPSFTDIQDTCYTDKNGNPYIRTLVKGKVLIIDAETGYTVQCAILGGDNDRSGKSGGKAITEAIKRFEMKLFHISSKDDIDPDSGGCPDDYNNLPQPQGHTQSRANAQGYGPQGQYSYQPQQQYPQPQQQPGLGLTGGRDPRQEH